MSYRTNSSSNTESHASVPGQSPTNYDAHRGTIVAYDATTGDLEVTADGTNTILYLLQNGAPITDFTGLSIPAEPDPGPDHDDWESKWGGLSKIPANGKKIIVRVKFEFECYEEQV